MAARWFIPLGTFSGRHDRGWGGRVSGLTRELFLNFIHFFVAEMISPDIIQSGEMHGFA
jgi:hypothetical protein